MTHARANSTFFSMLCLLLLTCMLSGSARPVHSAANVFQVHTAPAVRGAGYFVGAGMSAKFLLLPYATIRVRGTTPPGPQITFHVRGAHDVTLSARVCESDDPTTPQLNEAPRTMRGYTEWTYRPQHGWNISRWRGRLQVSIQAEHNLVRAQQRTTFTIDKRKQIVLVARSWQRTNPTAFAQAGLNYCCQFTADIYRQVGLPCLPPDDVRSQYAVATVPDNGDGTLVFYMLRGHRFQGGTNGMNEVAHVAIKDGRHRININGYPDNGRHHYSIQGLYDGLSRYYARTVAFRSTVNLDDTTLVIPSATPMIVERTYRNAQGQLIVCPCAVPALVSQSPYLAPRQPRQSPAQPVKAARTS